MPPPRGAHPCERLFPAIRKWSARHRQPEYEPFNRFLPERVLPMPLPVNACSVPSSPAIFVHHLRCSSIGFIGRRGTAMPCPYGDLAASRTSGHAGQIDGEFRALILFRKHADAAAMRLHDLINNGQAQARAAHKVRLQRLEDFLALSWVQTHARVAETNAHPEWSSFQ